MAGCWVKDAGCKVRIKEDAENFWRCCLLASFRCDFLE